MLDGGPDRRLLNMSAHFYDCHDESDDSEGSYESEGTDGDEEGADSAEEGGDVAGHSAESGFE